MHDPLSPLADITAKLVGNAFKRPRNGGVVAPDAQIFAEGKRLPNGDGHEHARGGGHPEA